MIKLIIKGRPASKKNSRRIFGKVSLPSVAYERFQAEAVLQIREEMHKKGWTKISIPVRIDYVFFQKGRMRQDVDNAMGSVNDVLQDAGLIQDDNLIVKGTFEKIGGCPNWSTYITIRNLDI